MSITLGLLLAVSFLVTLVALAVLIWSIADRQITIDQRDAETIFAEGEQGRPDTGDADRPHHFDPARAGIDRVSAGPVLVMLGAAAFWLVLGSAFGLIASIKLHLPDWLDAVAPLTFGRVRTMHLDIVAYGWASQAGLACMTWIIPRIFRTPLRFPRLAMTGALLWNAGMVIATWALAHGWNDGLEWLEIPWQIDILLAAGAGCFVLPLMATAAARKVHHIYVSGWYFLAAILWFPMLFIIANLPGVHFGVEQATMNWWYAHNVLGLWLTPIGVGTAYYFIPKIIGKPIYSYSLSLLGFWGLALFYSQVGIHHLIGGPVPTWVVTLSVVQSVMMFIPVIAVAVNQHVTVARNLWALKVSLPLRFIAFGALMYTAASFEGSLEALRSLNTITHFTQFTIGHAHLGAYAFVTLVLFGAAYHIVPRATGRAFPWPALINWHFWLVVVGFAIYFVSLTVGGIFQGLDMLDAAKPFSASVVVLKPYLEGRTVGGTLMTLGHILFAINLLSVAFASRAAATAGMPAE